MERIESPVLLLVKDHLLDGAKIDDIIDYLVLSEVIRVERVRSFLLDFFAGRKETPVGIVLYMNSRYGIGIYPGRNFRMLGLTHCGAHRLSEVFETQIGLPSGQRTFTEYLFSIWRANQKAAFFDN